MVSLIWIASLVVFNSLHVQLKSKFTIKKPNTYSVSISPTLLLTKLIAFHINWVVYQLLKVNPSQQPLDTFDAQLCIPFFPFFVPNQSWLGQLKVAFPSLMVIKLANQGGKDAVI